jgi:hypothetical protein
MTDRLVPSATAALLLGVTMPALRGWRVRGVGPAYVRLPGACSRRGDWPEKKHGRICYSVAELERFWKAREVQAGRMPRPFPGRLPRGV